MRAVHFSIPVVRMSILLSLLVLLRTLMRLTLRGQLRKLREEPVAVFKEPVFVDGVEIIPVFVCITVVVLCIGTKMHLLQQYLGLHWFV